MPPFAAAPTTAPLAVDDTAGAEAAARFADAPAAFRALVAGAAGAAPYLARLIAAEHDWLAQADALSAEALRDTALARIGATEDLSADLRRAKRRIALLTALADLGGVWDLEAVTGALSDLAERALEAAVVALVAQARAAGRLPDGPDGSGGLFVLALGKLGARELNYSSDIDLILLFDESRYPGDDYPRIRKGFIWVAQALVKLLSETRADGYVFRTDLRLRPDPSVTPVCIGMAAAERYYEAQGRTWERAAFIRARAVAGDHAAGARFLEALQPFIWRRHMDFAAIQDAHDMRLRIRDHKGLGGPFALPGHDVKLGRGGIREIEFFIQTKQLICGGRAPDLRVARTRPALAALTAAGWVPPAPATRLDAAYVAHRTLEHRLQMIEDAHTHIYPAAADARARVAALAGQADLPAFEAAEAARFHAVHADVEAFFRPDAQGSAADPAADPAPAPDPWAGFPDPARAADIATAWPDLPALRSARARDLFARLAPQMATRLAAGADPDRALDAFDRFLRGLPAGVQAFALFDANPNILDLLADICATAPRLAGYLGRHPRVFDAVLSPGFFDPLPAASDLTAALAGQLARAAGDYETVLDTARIWAREQAFRVGVQILRRIADTGEGAAGFTAVAEAVVAALLPHVVAEHARRFGPPPGNGLAILGMGKLGSREMTATSDLDLIVIYDPAGQGASEGAKPLAAPAYYARLTQALIAALTAPTAEGALYRVDMRLRPSGRQGPVAVGLTGFADYQTIRAWTWEHLALTRARVIAAAGPNGAAVAAGAQAAVAQALAVPRDPAQVVGDVRDMRARLLAEKPGGPAWALRDGPGGMLDIELALQTGRLLHAGGRARAPRRMLPDLTRAGWLSSAEAGDLDTTLGCLQTVQQITRLALDGDATDPGQGGPGLAALTAAALDLPDLETVARTLDTGKTRAARIVAAILDRTAP
ncbi:MAG: bifunctional [glutamine synthetase] adenylyltransferase/[glutamine synthetase]-adenylyl-L-tyrosine phosphorylase [Pseudomonadota bacterium]